VRIDTAGRAPRALLWIVLAAGCGGGGATDRPDDGVPSDAPTGAVNLELRVGNKALTEWDFGQVAVGAHSPALALTVVNTSDQATGVLEVRLEGTDAAVFDTGEADTDCDGGVVLTPGATCAVRVRFRPAQEGRRVARLVASGGAGASTALDLAGEGVPRPSGCTDAGGTTMHGDFRVRVAADLPALTGVSQITGDLIIEAPGLTTLSLPNLAIVGRHLSIAPDSTGLAELSLPALCSVGGKATVAAGKLTRLDLPRLATVGV